MNHQKIVETGDGTTEEFYEQLLIINEGDGATPLMAAPAILEMR